jgi:hypothetical protein
MQGLAVLAVCAGPVWADTVTDWNNYSILATKGANSATTGTATIALNSNVASRIEAMEARAVFDAINAVTPFSETHYYYAGTAGTSKRAGSAAAAAAQAAHDVLAGTLPNTPAWAATRTWLDGQLASDLVTLGVDPNTDAGITAGRAAAAAALSARAGDGSAIRTAYIPSTNISATGTPNDTGNSGVGLWRPSNGGAGDIDPNTGAPTGFAAGVIQPSAGVDFNWKNVTPFSLTVAKKRQLVAASPSSMSVGSSEYQQELQYVSQHGQEFSTPGARSADQLLQALYYKADAEILINEAARDAARLHGLTLVQNARLFAALDAAIADARIAAFSSKYELAFWRPITAINAAADGSVASYAWKPLATTPSHPSSTSGHSATVAAGAQILRAFFKSDAIDPAKAPVTLSSLPWLIGTNGGSGKLSTPINGNDATTRAVSTFSQVQLETGQSRVYLGVHFGWDNYQGQALGLAVADSILQSQSDPAVRGLSIFAGGDQVATSEHLHELLAAHSADSGFFER